MFQDLNQLYQKLVGLKGQLRLVHIVNDSCQKRSIGVLNSSPKTQCVLYLIKLNLENDLFVVAYSPKQIFCLDGVIADSWRGRPIVWPSSVYFCCYLRVPIT